MKIAIENVLFNQQDKRGIGTYLEKLADAMALQGDGDEFILFNYFFRDFERKSREVAAVERKNFSYCIRRFPQRWAEWLEWKAGVPIVGRLLPGGVDIYHGIETRLPRLSRKIKTVVTVHDIMLGLFPQWANRSCEIERSACRRADHLIAISENTRKDLVKTYGIPEEKITVIHYGMDHAVFFPIRDKDRLDEVRSRYRLPKRFLLSTGPFEPRRNTEGLLEVFGSLCKEEDLKDLHLVVPGRHNFYFDTVRRKISELRLDERVLLPGHIPHADLAAMYSLCDAFVYPSLYEGFGLTPLEALACGTPVVTSRVASIPEVVGDAAVLVDPKDSGDIKAAVLRVLRDNALRLELRARGPLRAKNFEWKTAAERTRALYRQIMGGKGGRS